MEETHLTDNQLERYVTGAVFDKAELRWMEDHLYRCPGCQERMWAAQDAFDDPDGASTESDTPWLYRNDGPLQ